MKKFLTGILAATLIFAAGCDTHSGRSRKDVKLPQASEEPKSEPKEQVKNEIVVDGKKVKLDIDLYYENDELMLGAKNIADAIGATLTYTEGQNYIYMKRNLDYVSATVGETRIYTSNGEAELNVAPAVVDGVLVVPASMLEESFDISCELNEETGYVELEFSETEKQVQMKSIKEAYTDKDGNLLVSVDIAYPCLVNEKYPKAVSAVNKKMEEYAQQYLAEAKVNADDLEAEGIVPEENMETTHELGYRVSYYDGEVICYYLSSYIYSGGAHGMPYAEGYTYSLKEDRELTAADLVDLQGAEVREFVQTQFLKAYNSEDNRFFPGADEDIMSDTFAWKEYLAEDGYYFMVQPYALGPFSAGFIDCKVPVKEGVLKGN